MKLEMEMEQIEEVLEKIWDLHDKLSDAIHSISRAHYLHSINNNNSLSQSNKNPSFNNNNNNNDSAADNRRRGFVFVKDGDDYSAVQEAKSLNAIRSALENLEDQLEFFHTVQIQQRAERDAAIARLEQSRIVLAMRLAQHQGKKFQVIEEALAFVGDVHLRNAGSFVSHDDHYPSAPHPSGENFVPDEGKRSSNLVKVLIRGFNFATKSLKLDEIGGILGNAALVAISMLALLHLHQVACKDKCCLELPQKQEDCVNSRSFSKVSQVEGSSSGGRMTRLDVMSARG